MSNPWVQAWEDEKRRVFLACKDADGMCSECSDVVSKTGTWFRCKDTEFCSVECAIAFLLRREAQRA